MGWEHLPFNAGKLGLFKYVSTFTVQSLGSHIQKILGFHPKIQNEMRDLELLYSLFNAGKLVFQICIHICCAIIGVSYTENPRCTLENTNWAERVVVFAIRRRKISAFQTCIYFYCAIFGVLFAELKINKAFQWIPLSKELILRIGLNQLFGGLEGVTKTVGLN